MIDGLSVRRALAAAALSLALIAHSTFAQVPASVPFSVKDAQGRDVPLPLGAASFADRVVTFRVGFPQPIVEAQAPDRAVGEPDVTTPPPVARGRAGGPLGFFSLGCGGQLTLAFDDNRLIDVPGPDLYVFEIGANVEPTRVAISADGSVWREVGEIAGGRASLDIGDHVQAGESFRFVQLVDLQTACGDDTYTGADVDAVAAVGSTAAVVRRIDFVMAEPPFSRRRFMSSLTAFRIEMVLWQPNASRALRASFSRPGNAEPEVVDVLRTDNPLVYRSEPVLPGAKP